MREINRIIVHYSASDNINHDDIQVIDKWHRDRGWDSVGYHYFITRRGQVQYGRNLWVQGAHTKGHNEDSVGICLSGKDDFTLAQYSKLKELIESLNLVFGTLDVYPHKAFNGSTPCPNFDLAEIGY